MIKSPKHKEARRIILECVEGSSTPSQAVDSLLDSLKSKDEQILNGDGVWSSCLELFSISFDPPAQDQSLSKLVDFVRELKQRPESERPTESTHSAEGRGMTFWNTFVMTSREMWNDEEDLTSTQWRNFNAFCAMLWAEKVWHGSLYPLWCLRSELEQKPRNEADITIYASQAYIEFAGSQMFASQETWDFNRPGDPKSGNRAAPGPLLQGYGQIPNGYSVARWSFWRRRFEQIAKLSGAPEEIRRTAQRALTQMDKIEAGG